jgi:hypothetical protein
LFGSFVGNVGKSHGGGCRWVVLENHNRAKRLALDASRIW